MLEADEGTDCGFAVALLHQHDNLKARESVWHRRDPDVRRSSLSPTC